MAAGLGFKTFVTGDVLSAGDTNGYLMQGVLVFASAAARDAAITSPQEGQFAYLKDTDATTYYTGSAWTSIGGAVSTNWTLLNAGGTALTGGGASVRTVSFTAQSSLLIYVTGASCTGAEQMMFRLNTDTGSNYIEIGNRFSSTGVQTSVGGTQANFRFGETAAAANTLFAEMYVWGAKGTTEPKGVTLTGGGITGGATATFSYAYNGLYTGTSAITSISVVSNASAFDAGTVYVYGA